MEFVLLIVIVLQFVYIVYKDILFSKEREALQLKLMSKDVVEYKRATEPVAKDKPKKPQNEYVPVEEMPVDRIVNAGGLV